MTTDYGIQTKSVYEVIDEERNRTKGYNGRSASMPGGETSLGVAAKVLDSGSKIIDALTDKTDYAGQLAGGTRPI